MTEPREDEQYNWTRLTLETGYATTMIELRRGDLDIHDMIDSVVRPLLLGAGYMQQNVDDVLGEV